MSAEKIIDQIKKDSDLEVKQILGEAEIQAKSILQSAKNDAEMEAEKILDNGKKQSENLKKILISKANQDIKRDIMNAREDVIDECFTKAHHKFSILKGDNYEKLVRKLIKDGHSKLGENYTVLISRDIDKKIAQDLQVDVSGSLESSGGVVLKSADGKVTLDHTFNGILKREKHKIRIKVGKLLFS
jgi:V/A-type H+-transporting ATPase subunit E